MPLAYVKSTPLLARFLCSLLLLVAGAAIAAALSPQPMRWFVRGTFLASGVAGGIAILARLRVAEGSPATGEQEHPARMWQSLLRWSWRALVLIFWSKVIALALRYVGRDALPYFRFEEKHYGPFWPRRWWLIAHICGGVTALVLGPVQFWSGLRGMDIDCHRWTGRAYVFGVLLAAAPAYRLAPFIDPAEGAMRSGMAMMILATVWLASTALAIRAILHRRIEAHREWMTRSYILAFAFVNIRWLIDLPMLGALGPPQERIPLIIWFSWTAPLAVTEAALFWKRQRQTAA